VNFFDTSGLDEFKSIRTEFYANTQIVLLVFDVNQQATFDHCTQWIDEYQQYASINNKHAASSSQQPIVALCANKVADDSAIKRVVSESTGRELAQSNQWLYHECSAKSGFGVEELFENILQQYADKLTQQHAQLRR
jgi:GTPase SAR1 family protein